MNYLLVATNSAVFLALAALHVRWVFQLKMDSSPVVPTLEGKPVFQPGRMAKGVVALGLFGFAYVTLSAVTGWLPARWVFYGNLAIGGIFLLRAVGDFRYVGFFKKVKNTAFARNDTRYYSPLCLLLGVIALGVAWRLKELSEP